ncbi:hypothetical protein [Arthrobacter mobilis]|uniref:Uncharacterized protein n=1 Tax=Arthrobacter mobilis TaxID=2724944 RepID=A0A7X6K704_9MICC|nr:hypothetical protein [Arthrobacter mobilis]NKX56183.1 hypothetical protein [Arthrobacter mobilis]
MLIQLLAATETHAEAHVSPLLVGSVIFGIFLLLMFSTIAFRSVGHRHPAVEEHADPHRQHPNKHDHGQGVRH